MAPQYERLNCEDLLKETKPGRYSKVTPGIHYLVRRAANRTVEIDPQIRTDGCSSHPRPCHPNHGNSNGLDFDLRQKQIIAGFDPSKSLIIIASLQIKFGPAFKC